MEGEDKSRDADHYVHQDLFLTIKILRLSKGIPLAGSASEKWHLGWFSFDKFKDVLVGSEVILSEDMFVYLGYENGVVYWGIDVSLLGESLVRKFGAKQLCFVQLTTLMIATDWSDEDAMGQLAIAGHVVLCHPDQLIRDLRFVTTLLLEFYGCPLENAHHEKKKKSLDYNNSFFGEYECSSLALDRKERRDAKEEIGLLETRSNNVSDQEI
ncbi:hypothetical protein Tco_0164378 [Tanacetum coccineum]